MSKPVSRNSVTNLPKPFILLSGISGTGKTRFVREQANMAAKLFNLSEGNNYCLVPVRPDWHEPSDLLGYISRINGTRYISTDFLKFTLKAICAAVESCDGTEIQWKSTDKIPPFWLCLDEMNLAPVEQYFADFLSILETQNRSEHGYTSDPILKPGLLKQLALSEIEPEKNSLVALWDELFDGTDFDNQEVLCEYFKIHGIPLPINLIVAGTVNMDETTHGFSRKVIDRALTIDFQEFYPNDYDTFFRGQLEPKLLWFPQRTNSDEMDLPAVDKNNEKSKSTEFLKTVNSILKNTPFELGYRALNELLLSVTCFNPKTNEELQAVWDDYLMQKILPRIEGDSQKLKFLDGNDSGSPSSRYLSDAEREFGKGSLLHNLYNVLESELLKDIWGDKQNLHKRPDLLRETEEPIECRSKKKLLWMLRRLKANHFTDFWV
ncbi:MAG: restriction endonuclease [Bacteroidetes bacterium]|nr:restriction endonuclease [Bacteroidota bacterium]